jgi:hypothetical protein
MTVKSQIFSKLPIFVSTFMLMASATFAAAPLMPFSKGAIWIYEGEVSEQKNESDQVEKKRIKLVMEIIEVHNYSSASVAVVRGFLSELPWYATRRHPHLSLLILSQDGLFELETREMFTGGEERIKEVARQFESRSAELMQKARLVFPFPLSDGKRFNSHVIGFRPSPRTMVYTNIQQDNPDRIVTGFVPGLGIVSYGYQHFGAVSTVDVTLKEIRVPRKK